MTSVPVRSNLAASSAAYVGSDGTLLMLSSAGGAATQPREQRDRSSLQSCQALSLRFRFGHERLLPVVIVSMVL
jgi:hypothetical protein